MADSQQQNDAPQTGQGRGEAPQGSQPPRLVSGSPKAEEFDFDAFAAQSQQQNDLSEEREAPAPPVTVPEPTEAAEAAQTSTEEESGSQAPPEQEASPEKPQRPSDRFQSEEDARRGYDNLMTLQARQAAELGELRRIAARAEAEKAVRAEMQQQPTRQQQQQSQAPSPDQLAYERAVEFQKTRYGLDDDEARIAAQEMMGLVDYIARHRIDQAAAAVRPLVEERQKAQELQDRVNRVALEADYAGQPVRPDWEDVTNSEEFAQVVQQEPELINSDLGLKHAYQTAKYMQMSSPKRLAQEATRLKEEAREVVEKEKSRAAGAGGSNAAPTANAPSKEQQAFDSMFNVDTDRHWLMGGGRRGS